MYYNAFAVRVQRKRTILAHVFVIIFLCFMSGERELKPTTKKQLKMEGVQREAKK